MAEIRPVAAEYRRRLGQSARILVAMNRTHNLAQLGQSWKATALAARWRLRRQVSDFGRSNDQQIRPAARS